MCCTGECYSNLDFVVFSLAWSSIELKNKAKGIYGENSREFGIGVRGLFDFQEATAARLVQLQGNAFKGAVEFLSFFMLFFTSKEWFSIFGWLGWHCQPIEPPSSAVRSSKPGPPCRS